MSPDMEAFAWAALKDLGGITVFQVDGGKEWPGRIDLCQLQVDVRASSKKRARDRAYAARDRILDWEAANWIGKPLVVQAVDVVQGPAWLPEPDGAPRYVFRVDLRVHPQP
jgi:hypothetical protein